MAIKESFGDGLGLEDHCDHIGYLVKSWVPH
jgi:hypothetical protein